MASLGLAAGGKQTAKIVMGIGITGLEANGLLELFQRGIGLAGSQQ